MRPAITDVSQFTVVERISRQKDHASRETLHLAQTRELATGLTICGRPFRGITMIPPASWGKPDEVEGLLPRLYCRKCCELKDQATRPSRRKRTKGGSCRAAVEPTGESPEE